MECSSMNMSLFTIAAHTLSALNGSMSILVQFSEIIMIIKSFFIVSILVFPSSLVCQLSLPYCQSLRIQRCNCSISSKPNWRTENKNNRSTTDMHTMCRTSLCTYTHTHRDPTSTVASIPLSAYLAL